MAGFDRVCYRDGWHWSVVPDADGNDTPGVRLFLDDDGEYRVAAEEDASWHERKHERFATVEMADGGAGLRVSAEEMAEIQLLLAERRAGAS